MSLPHPSALKSQSQIAGDFPSQSDQLAGEFLQTERYFSEIRLQLKLQHILCWQARRNCSDISAPMYTLQWLRSLLDFGHSVPNPHQHSAIEWEKHQQTDKESKDENGNMQNRQIMEGYLSSRKGISCSGKPRSTGNCMMAWGCRTFRHIPWSAGNTWKCSPKTS